jgi:hypothetical protein
MKAIPAMAAAAVVLSATIACAAEADPPSGIIDPPPGPQDYIKSFPQGRWMFGRLLWQGVEPCDDSRCEAAFNDEPLFVLVQKERNCCGGDGYSITVIVRVEGCSGVGYYLVFSKDLDRMNPTARQSLVTRHLGHVASAMRANCGIKQDGDIPTDGLERLWR